jgi:hypothetical protein
VSAPTARGPARMAWGLAAVVVLCVTVGGPPARAEAAAFATASPPLGTVVLPAVGPGYAVTSQGPLDPASFAANAPDPSAAAGALATLGRTVDTYQRIWLDDSHTNAVQDLLVRFSSAAAAQVFLQAARHALDSGEIVGSGPVDSVPDAQRTTYFGTTNQPGVGEAITMRAGRYVALVSFFSSASGNPHPITPADATQVAKAQQAAMVRAPGGRDTSARGLTVSSLGWAALTVGVLAAAVATPMVLRRRKARGVSAI